MTKKHNILFFLELQFLHFKVTFYFSTRKCVVGLKMRLSQIPFSTSPFPPCDGFALHNPVCDPLGLT